MTNGERPSPVGGTIERFFVRGKEHDSEGCWKGADLELCVAPMGRYLLNVVTKQHFADEEIETALNTDELIEIILEEMPGSEVLETRPPFVLNDREITDDILHRKFNGRKIEEDLADSMYFESPDC